ncbi:DUF6461 domain-containing protein [Nonomuraea sp. NPDC049419]|uniref:DUF6461 domain-containing protein n=1 Tax=Nonomuraea sp. NPDC049419 TaxID=3155772 RepID=UPI003442F002
MHDLLVDTLFTEGLDDEGDLWTLGFSAMWITGADVESVARSFGLDPVTRTPCHLHEILDHAIDDGSRWVAEAGDWIGVIPAHSDGESLRTRTYGARQALGLTMDINHKASFDYGRDGRLITSFDPLALDWRRYGDDPYALDHLMDGLRFTITDDDVRGDDRVEDPESITSALTLIGRFTGTDIAADWILARHSRMRPDCRA